jgi:hypothetical protein
MTHPWYTRELLNLKNHKARGFKYSSRTRNHELYERLRAEHKHLYTGMISYRDGIENGDPRRFFDFANYKKKMVGYPFSMRYDLVGDCPADICDLFADLFESVYNVDACDSDTEDASGPSYGCGFSGIRLRMSDSEAAISGLDANLEDFL